MVEKPELHILDDLNGIAEDLFELFRGDDTRFGTFDIDRLRLVGDKVEMKDENEKGPRDVKRPPTVADVLAHLEGRRPIGIWPARKDGMTRRVVIDIDGKDVTGGYRAIKRMDIVKQVEKLGLPLVDTESKSGGVHLDCFLTEWVAQARAYALGRQMATRLGFPKCEIFPPESGPSNWVILPYLRLGNRTTQRCYRRPLLTGQMELAEYRDFAKSRRVSIDAAEAAVRTTRRDKEADGPARAKRDLEAFAVKIAATPEGGVLGGLGRNKTLFGCAKDMGKMIGAKWISEDEVSARLLRAATTESIAPQSHTDAVRTIDNGIQAGKTEEPDAANDDRYMRIARLIVWEGAEETELEIWLEGCEGSIRKPVKEITNHWMFNNHCVGTFKRSFRQMKQDRWADELDTALGAAEVRQVPPDQTPQGMFLIMLRQFCSNAFEYARDDKAKAQDDIKRLLLKLPVEMEDEGRIYFRFIDLKNYLNDYTAFKGWSSTKIGTMLNKVGKEGVDWDITKKKLYGPDAKASDVRWVRSDLFDGEKVPEIPVPPLPVREV